MSLIIAARRTAVTPRGGAFHHLEPHQLAAPVISSLLQQSGIAGEEVDNIIVANALAAGGNPARLLALAAGLPHLSGITIDSQCAGGVDALMLASALVNSGAASIVLAGGVESYSRRPLRAKTFIDGRPPEFYTRPAFSPFPAEDPDMTEAAEQLASHYGISRSDQDNYAIASHRKAVAAASRLSDEIEPVLGITTDTYSRILSQGLVKRAPVLVGSVSLAATAVEADGAAFCLVVSEAVAARLTPGICAEITDYYSAGGDSRLPGAAPVMAINTLLARHPEVDRQRCLTEMMEAYAAQALVCIQQTGLGIEHVNIGGGALARGHPIGASGTILACRLFHEFQHSDSAHGLCAIAAAGGLGAAMLLSRRQHHPAR